jgi:hypothetical protein
MTEGTMSDHAWVQEHVAAYVAGGLDAQEAERLEAHARDCPTCAAAVADARRLDDCLSNLFVSARPAPALEDRAVTRLRAAPPRWPVLARRARWAGAVAAVLLLGVVGALAGSLESNGVLRAPGEPPASPPAGAEVAYAPRQWWRNDGRVPVMPPLADGAPPSLDSNLEAALPVIDRLDKATVDATVTGDPIGKPNAPAFALNGTLFDPIGKPNAPDTDTSALNAPGAEDEKMRHAADALKQAGKRGSANTTGYAEYTTPWNGVGPWEENSNRTYVNKASGMPPPASTLFDPTAARPVPGDPAQPPKQPDPKGEPAKQEPPAKTEPKAPPGDPKAPDANPAPSPDPGRRVVLRSGDIEFEVESFDAALATVTKLVTGIKGAFVATVNSDKLPNGKVKGSITVRVPPEQLDGLVLDLRRELGKGGELKGVKLTSQDVTKNYTDLESRLRAARTMETRLLQIIKEGKGEIKQLLEAERELGVWRTRIEETEGELRYYANLAALSTLTVVLAEKEIRTAATVTERERVQAGVEVEDVDKAYQQLLAAVTEAKGRVTKSELKQLTAGQFNATFHFEVAAEQGGPLRDRLRMLGRVARLEIDRAVQAEGGTLPPDAKPKRGDTVFLVQLYNLANVAPRETATLQVAAPDVPAAYQALRDAVAKTTGRVLVAQLNEQDRQNVSAQFDFEVRRADEGAARAALDAAGEVVSRQVTRAAETESVTDAKVLYRTTLLSAGRLKPRETAALAVEVADVEGSATLFAAQVAEAKGRQVDAKLDRDAGGHATARLVFEVPLAAAAGLVERFKAAGTVRLSQSVRDPQAADGRYATARIHVALTNAEAIVPEGGGLGAKVRRGLSISAAVLLTSVTWVVFGLCVVLPWAVIGFGGYRIVRRITRSSPAAPAAPAAPPPASA